MTSFAKLRHHFPLAKTMLPHPIASSGNANAEILKLPKPSHATSNEVNVVPILAPISTPTALLRCITPAHTKAIAIKETRLLLCRIAVINVHDVIDLHAHCV